MFILVQHCCADKNHIFNDECFTAKLYSGSATFLFVRNSLITQVVVGFYLKFVEFYLNLSLLTVGCFWNSFGTRMNFLPFPFKERSAIVELTKIK